MVRFAVLGRATPYIKRLFALPLEMARIQLYSKSCILFERKLEQPNGLHTEQVQLILRSTRIHKLKISSFRLTERMRKLRQIYF